ncbi:TPA: hypothetical protein ACGOWA_001261 [Streptococcus suis]
MLELKVDGISTKTIVGCIVAGLGEDRASSPRFVEETVYGMNGTNRTIEAYDEVDRVLTFHCASLEAVRQLIKLFKGLDKRLEFWHIPNSFYYFDYKSSSYKINHKCSWDVSIKISLKPFRYLSEVEDIVLTQSGAITNIGDIFSEPRIEVFGNGTTSLTIGKQVLRLNLDTKAVIECRHGYQNIYDKNGVIKNSIRISGPFFEIPAQVTSGVVLGSGINRVVIHPRWRCEI